MSVELEKVVFAVHDRAVAVFEHRVSLTGPQILLPVESIAVNASGPFAETDVLTRLRERIGELPRLDRLWQITTRGFQTWYSLRLQISVGPADVTKDGVRIGPGYVITSERRHL